MQSQGKGLHAAPTSCTLNTHKPAQRMRKTKAACTATSSAGPTGEEHAGQATSQLHAGQSVGAVELTAWRVLGYHTTACAVGLTAQHVLCYHNTVSAVDLTASFLLAPAAAVAPEA
jgi:hypothetical protein